MAEVVREHKAALKAYLGGLVAALGVPDPEQLTEQLQILVEGAITAATITGDATTARHARATAELLLGARTLR